MKPRLLIRVVFVAFSAWASSLVVVAQSSANHQHGNNEVGVVAGSVSDQLRALHEKVQNLEQMLSHQVEDGAPAMNKEGQSGAKLEMKRQGMGTGDSMSGMKSGSSSGMNMGSGSGMGGMGMMNMMKGQGMGMGGAMSGMGDSSASGMSMGSGMEMGGMGMMNMMKGKGMRMMGKMKAMNGQTMIHSALPGFPGASHLYHIGASDFFLDHGDHLGLERDQIERLNEIREGSTLSEKTTEREVEQAEQELWELTAEGEPDVRKIESKIRHIEKLKGEQRIEFIRSVGQAAEVLSQMQIDLLIGKGSVESGGESTKHQH